MTTITIPPDLESRLDDEARRRGTPELLALDGLRRLFASSSHSNGDESQGTLFDFLNGYVGTVAGVAEPFSEDCGHRFAEDLAEKQQRGRL